MYDITFCPRCSEHTFDEEDNVCQTCGYSKEIFSTIAAKEPSDEEAFKNMVTELHFKAKEIGFEVFVVVAKDGELAGGTIKMRQEVLFKCLAKGLRVNKIDKKFIEYLQQY